MDRIKSLFTKIKPLYAYACFTSFNLLIHLINYQRGIFGEYLDYLLYIAKIAICIFVLRSGEKPDDNAKSKVDLLFRLIIACDLFEMFVSFTMTSLTGLALWMLIGLLVIKFVLDWTVYARISRYTQRGFLWYFGNVGCVVLFTFYLKIGHLALLYTLIVLRLLIKVYVLRKPQMLALESASADKAETDMKAEAKLSKTWNKIALAVTVLLACVFLFLRYGRVPGQYELTTQSGKQTVRSSSERLEIISDNREEYSLTNWLPEWTGFHMEWYGLADSETGDKTGAVYRNELIFDESGIAWDYAGHFIDTNGNAVITVSPLVMERRTGRMNLLIYAFDEYLNERRYDGDYHSYLEYSSNLEWEGKTVLEGNIRMYRRGDFHDHESAYFENHIAPFYSEAKGAYGFINDQGKIIVSPDYVSYYDYDSDYEYVTLTKKFSSAKTIVNSNGDFILGRFNSWDYIVSSSDNNLIFAKKDNEVELYDHEGSRLNADSFYPDLGKYMYTGDIVVLTKRISSDGHIYSAVVLDKRGEELFDAGGYDEFYGYEDASGSVEYVMARRESNDNWVLLSKDGNKAANKEFSEIQVLDDSAVYERPLVVSVDSVSGKVSIIYFDGRVIDSEYQYFGYNSDYKLIIVTKVDSDGYPLYNYLGLDGELLYARWTYRELK